VGRNFSIDVFEPPVPLKVVPARVRAVLGDLRHRDLPAAGLDEAVPIRVTENGWPTGTNPLTGEQRADERRTARKPACSASSASSVPTTPQTGLRGVP